MNNSKILYYKAATLFFVFMTCQFSHSFAEPNGLSNVEKDIQLRISMIRELKKDRKNSFFLKQKIGLLGKSKKQRKGASCFTEKPIKNDKLLKRNRDENRFDNLIYKSAAINSISPFLVKAVIKQESDFNPYAVSRKGARGLMQLMPDTAKDLGVKNVYIPFQNINGGSRYLKQLLVKYKGSLPLALAAYNAGPNAVDIHRGVPPYKETKNYVKKVLKNYNTYIGEM